MWFCKQCGNSFKHSKEENINIKDENRELRRVNTELQVLEEKKIYNLKQQLKQKIIHEVFEEIEEKRGKEK